jgi:hypothetical protein
MDFLVSLTLRHRINSRLEQWQVPSNILYLEFGDNFNESLNNQSLIEASQDEFLLGWCTADHPRRSNRLQNRPLTSHMRARLRQAALRKRQAEVREEAEEYCSYLYESAYEILLERKSFMEKRKNDKESFEQEAARLSVLQPLRRAGHICVNLRSSLSGEERLITLQLNSSYYEFYHAARAIWNQPTNATSISMRLWDPEDARYTITAPGKAKVNRWMDGRTLCIHFYS